MTGQVWVVPGLTERQHRIERHRRRQRLTRIAQAAAITIAVPAAAIAAAVVGGALADRGPGACDDCPQHGGQTTTTVLWIAPEWIEPL